MNAALATNGTRGLPTKIDPAGDVINQLAARFGGLQRLVHRRNSPRVKQALDEWRPLRPDVPAHEERARKRLAVIPGLSELCEQRDALRAAVFTRASEAEMRLIIAAMIDSIPAARAQATAAFFDAVVYNLAHSDEDISTDAPHWRSGIRGFSPTVIFAAARRVLASHRFAPAPAEVLELARSARREYWAALDATKRLIELRLNAEAVLDQVYGVDEDITFDAEEDA